MKYNYRENATIYSFFIENNKHKKKLTFAYYVINILI